MFEGNIISSCRVSLNNKSLKDNRAEKENLAIYRKLAEDKGFLVKSEAESYSDEDGNPVTALQMSKSGTVLCDVGVGGAGDEYAYMYCRDDARSFYFTRDDRAAVQ